MGNDSIFLVPGWRTGIDKMPILIIRKMPTSKLAGLARHPAISETERTIIKQLIWGRRAQREADRAGRGKEVIL